MDKDYLYFIEKFNEKTGIDLSLYKEAQMKRRLTSFYVQKGFSSFKELFEGIEKNDELLHFLLDRMTINVSEFYRNPNRWEILQSKIIPDLLKNNPSLNIWSAACSTGEEPYTIAMVLSNYLSLSQIRILATDIDRNAIGRAKIGSYNERSLNEIPLQFKQKYFTNIGQQIYQIDKKVMQTVTFKQHNLLSDPFPNQMDLIVCRNVLIYFTEEAKLQLYAKFAKALKPGGILFVGSTEQIFYPEKYGLETLDTFFYRKK